MGFRLRNVLFWFVWLSSHAALFATGWYLQQQDERLALLNKLRFSVWFSRGAGLVLAADGVIMLLTMLRVTLTWLRPRLRGLPLDENVWLHKIAARTMLLFTIVHVTAHYVNFYNVERLKARPVKAWQIHYTQVGGLTGHTMLLCLLFFFTTSAKVVRVQSWSTFAIVHHLSAVVFFACYYSHSSGCFVRDTAQAYSITDSENYWKHCIGYQAWRVDGVIALIYMVERCYRLYRACWPRTRFLAAIQHPKGVVELRFEKPSMSYKAGQYLLLSIPGISTGFDYHPFTITSCPASDPYISVHIREVGDWTRAVGPYFSLYQRGMMEELDKRGIGELGTAPKVRIDGPYGCPAEDVHRNEFCVIVAAGIGITPWVSVLRQLWHQRQAGAKECKLRHLELIWVCKEVGAFAWIQRLLQEVETDWSNIGDGGVLRLHLYLTQKMKVDDVQHYALHDIQSPASSETLASPLSDSVSMTKGVDPFTKLRTRTTFGRPRWAQLLSRVKQECSAGRSSTRIGVYLCGPSALGRDLDKACRQLSSGACELQFHQEHF